MFFWKTSEGGGGGVISDPENYIADFVGFKAVYFGRKFWKKCPKKGERGGHRQSKKLHCKFMQFNVYLRKSAMKFPKRDGGGGPPGGTKALWTFLKTKTHQFLSRRSPLKRKIKTIQIY